MPDPNQQQATQQQGGAPPDAGQQQAAPESEQQPNGKGWEAAKQFKAELDSAKAKLAAYEAEKSQRERDDAVKRGEHEKLWKDAEKRAEAAEKRAADLFKRDALKSELVKLGVTNLASADFVDLSTIDPEGKNANEVAQKLVATFGTGKNGVPTPTPTPNPGGAPGVKVPAGVGARDVSSLTREQKQALVNEAKANPAGLSFRK